MQITIVSVEDKGKTCKYKTADGKTYNGVVSKIGKLLPNTTYEIEFKEEDFDKDGKTYKMKWIEKVTGGTPGVQPTSANNAQVVAKSTTSAVKDTSVDWEAKEHRGRKTMVLSYAKDIYCAQIAQGKLFTIADMIGWYEEMLKEVEK